MATFTGLALAWAGPTAAPTVTVLMQEAKRRIPHFALVEQYDVTALEETRAMMNRDRGSNPKLTLLPFLITALTKAMVNWRFTTTNAREKLKRLYPS